MADNHSLAAGHRTDRQTVGQSDNASLSRYCATRVTGLQGESTRRRLFLPSVSFRLSLRVKIYVSFLRYFGASTRSTGTKNYSSNSIQATDNTASTLYQRPSKQSLVYIMFEVFLENILQLTTNDRRSENISFSYLMAILNNHKQFFVHYFEIYNNTRIYSGTFSYIFGL